MYSCPIKAIVLEIQLLDYRDKKPDPKEAGEGALKNAKEATGDK
jgi:hypothetical protein